MIGIPFGGGGKMNLDRAQRDAEIDYELSLLLEAAGGASFLETALRMRSLAEIAGRLNTEQMIQLAARIGTGPEFRRRLAA
jgi:hypothetical protein